MRTSTKTLLFVSAAMANPLSAFDLIGVSWPNAQALYRIHPNFPDTDRIGSPDEQVDLLRCAADTWARQASVPFEFVFDGESTFNAAEDNSSDGLNTVSWVDVDGGDALAVTLISGRRGVAREFDMVFFATSAEGRAENHWAGRREPATGELDLLGVAVHEFGHALGLDHSNVGQATMVASIVGQGLPFRTLHPDDQAGAQALYGVVGNAEALPSIDELEPSQSPAAGGDGVVLLGWNFTWETDTVLRFGDTVIPPEGYVIESCDRLRILRVPPGSGTVDVTLSNSLGTVAIGDAFTYLGPAEPAPKPQAFVRGDTTTDGIFDLSDAVILLTHLFIGGTAPGCERSADVDADGALSQNDAIALLNFLFLGSAPPSAPFPNCGVETNTATLGCEAFLLCD